MGGQDGSGQRCHEVDVGSALVTLAELIGELTVKVDKIMASQADFDAKLTRIDTATDQIAAELKALADQVRNGGLTAAQEQAVADALEAKATRLEGIAADPNNVVPPPA